jgi:hypothetical protein
VLEELLNETQKDAVDRALKSPRFFDHSPEEPH